MFRLENPKGEKVEKPSEGLNFNPADYGTVIILAATISVSGYDMGVYCPYDNGWYNPKTGEKCPKKMGDTECLITDVLKGHEWGIVYNPEKRTYSIEIYITDDEVIKRLKEWSRTRARKGLREGIK